MFIDKNKIIKFIRSKKYSPLNANQLAECFEIAEEDYNEFCKTLRSLEFAGEIIKIKKDQYAWPKKLNLLVGTMDAKSQGYGFVIPTSNNIKDDIFISEEGMSGAMDGDLVVVRLPEKKQKKGKKGSGRLGAGKIIEILKRANKTVIGVLKKDRKMHYVVPDNSAISKDIFVAEGDLNEAEINDKVVVKIIQWPSRHLPPEGEVVKILGKDGAPGVDLQSILYQFELPAYFDSDVVKEAENITEIIPDEVYKQRLYLKEETIITIDPEDAKDFDDAVSLKQCGDNWVLGVHIADVSYYVKDGSRIDDEARVRGTSIYFPGEVIPMLPEHLSNGLCSLKQDKDRLTKSVFLTYDRKGNFLNSEIKNTIIRVTKRFNYKEVTKMLENPDENTTINNELSDLLLKMQTLAQILFIKRLARGSIELDIPEVDLKLNDDGEVIEVEKCVKDISHAIIEEFMLAANEAVACYADKNKLPCFYRLHEEPDEENMENFAKFVKGLQKRKFNPNDRKQLQSVMEGFVGEPEEYAVNLMLLRSFKRAIYSTSGKAHYALALEHYTHFTSPIRRYPDLVVHRALDLHFANQHESKNEPDDEDLLKEQANRCSFTERRAEEAERELIKIKLIRHMENRINDEVDGIITGVEEYGFFVQLQENLLEGLVHVRTLTDDYYDLDRKNMLLKASRKKKSYRIGDKIRVKICKVDKLKKQVDFRVMT